MVCAVCAHPLDLAQPQYQLRIERSARVEIGVYRCPQCGQLVLDDWIGWKGSGIVAHVTEADIAEYLETGRLPPRRP